MSGTKKGGLKTVKTVKAKLGEDWYEKIGAKGGKANKNPRMFALDRDLASRAGKIGGTITAKKRWG